ncbi:hypothetical protein [Mucilaginibacter sp. UYCu711]|uniref:hypothetical protein n=1 Tax=Mucilaginibacter sp. UYCu711 TaxID=3156339 RepID=UPI003D1C14D6
MRTIQIDLYGLDELSEETRGKALQAYSHINVDDDWWQFIYEDAKMVGLKLTGFDIDRGAYCNGELIADAKISADLILANHGEVTATYQTAKAFISQWQGDSDNQEELDNRFLSGILKDYLAILRYEYDYLTSEQAVMEAIIGNDYLFTADGRKANRLENLVKIQ